MWENIKQGIQNVVKENGVREITGDLLQQVLVNMVDALGNYATFGGVVPSLAHRPDIFDGPVFYLATLDGTYSGFSGVTLNNEVAVFTFGPGRWEKTTLFKKPYAGYGIEVGEYGQISVKSNDDRIFVGQDGLEYHATEYIMQSADESISTDYDMFGLTVNNSAETGVNAVSLNLSTTTELHTRAIAVVVRTTTTAGSDVTVKFPESLTSMGTNWKVINDVTLNVIPAGGSGEFNFLFIEGLKEVRILGGVAL